MGTSGHDGLGIDVVTSFGRQHHTKALHDIRYVILGNVPSKEHCSGGMGAVPVHYRGAKSIGQLAGDRRDSRIGFPSDLV